MRPWLCAKQTGAPFNEVVIALDTPETAAELRAHSTSGRVPVLKDGELVVWDSLAIAEYLAERLPQAKLWPEDAAARAVARSASAEMHSGFAALRQNLPVNVRRSAPRAGIPRAPTRGTRRWGRVSRPTPLPSRIQSPPPGPPRSGIGRRMKEWRAAAAAADPHRGAKYNHL